MKNKSVWTLTSCCHYVFLFLVFKISPSTFQHTDEAKYWPGPIVNPLNAVLELGVPTYSNYFGVLNASEYTCHVTGSGAQDEGVLGGINF